MFSNQIKIFILVFLISSLAVSCKEAKIVPAATNTQTVAPPANQSVYPIVTPPPVMRPITAPNTVTVAKPIPSTQRSSATDEKDDQI